VTAPHIAHAVWHTLRISVPTIWDGVRGTLDPEACDRRLDEWSRAIVSRAAIRLEVRGAELAAPGESFVLMSNHQSLYDIPVIYQALRRRIRMVAKQELFKVPIWGRAMQRAGFIALDRGNRERSREALSASVGQLQQGTSVWIAPEGTRSKTGELGTFRKGGFHLALQSGVRILPITILGTAAVLPAKGARVRNGCTVKVVVHPPIDPLKFGEARRDELVSLVRSAIASSLGSAEAGESDQPGFRSAMQ
jgi:1-acyl-sn-glycerol-3-phosphate acyltransferase